MQNSVRWIAGGNSASADDATIVCVEECARARPLTYCRGHVQLIFQRNRVHVFRRRRFFLLLYQSFSRKLVPLVLRARRLSHSSFISSLGFPLPPSPPLVFFFGLQHRACPGGGCCSFAQQRNLKRVTPVLNRFTFCVLFLLFHAVDEVATYDLYVRA